MPNPDCFMMKAGKCANFDCHDAFYPDCTPKTQGNAITEPPSNEGGFYVMCPQCGCKIPMQDEDDDDDG